MALGEYLGAGSGTTKGLWHLNGDANDSSGNGNNGTANNVSYAAGMVGSGCVLGGANPSISIPSTTMGTIGTGDFVISFWVNPNNPGSGRYPMLFGSFSTSSPYAGPTIFFDPLNVSGTGGYGIQFRCTYSNALNITSPSASSLYGFWTNIVFTRISGTMYVYYNGSLVGSKADNTNIPAAGESRIFSRDNTTQLFGSAGAKFDECIAETGRGRTQEQVKKYYTYTKGRFGIT